MSDPFSSIDQEVILDKAKNLFYRYKKTILVVLSLIIIVISAFLYINNKKINKNERLSGYLVEIIAIINQDQEKAVKELEKLSKLGSPGHEFLSNLLLSKIYLKKQDFSGAIDYLEKLEIKDKEIEPLIKLKYYFMSIAYLGLDKEEDFKKNINLLLSFGDYWSLLGHELRGHYLYSKGNYEGASKDFNKILNEQLSTQSLRQRAQEMINNIELYD